MIEQVLLHCFRCFVCALMFECVVGWKMIGIWSNGLIWVGMFLMPYETAVLCFCGVCIFPSLEVAQHASPTTLRGKVLEGMRGMASWNVADFGLWSLEVRLIDSGITNLAEFSPFARLNDDQVLGLKESVHNQMILWRTLMWMIGGFVCLVTFGPILGVLLCLILWAVCTFDDGKIVKENVEPIKREMLSLTVPGIYAVNRRILGFDVARGRGVFWKGVFHVPLHVCGPDSILKTDQAAHSPTFVSKSMDLVCWGGPPQMEAISDGEKVYAKIVDDAGNMFTSTALYHKNADGYGYFVCHRTRPGQSGCPIFTVREEGGKMVQTLVGLVGNNISKGNDGSDLWSVEGRQVEVVRPWSGGPEIEHMPLCNGTVYQIFKPPGAGKTRTILPVKVKEALETNRLVVISPPTRLICKEVSERMKALDIQVSECYQGGLNDPRAKVQIMPHAVLATRLARGHLGRNTPTLFIVDEVHSQDARCVFALRWLRNECNGDDRNPTSRHTLIEMTATGIEMRSREVMVCMEHGFVKDVKLGVRKEGEQNFRGDSPQEAFDAVMPDLVTMIGKKIVVFCPAVRASSSTFGCSIREIAKKVRSYGLEPICFHRQSFVSTYEAAKEKVPANEVRFVLTTNMSEVGVNLDADVCVDFQKQINFRSNNSTPTIFSRRLDDATQAQIVQRRGRVGRGREGIYIYSKSMEMEHVVEMPNMVEQYDAAMASTAFELRKIMPLEGDYFSRIGERLSAAQAVKWLQDTGLQGTLAAFLKYNIHGNLRSEEERKMILLRWGTGPKAVEIFRGGVKIKTRYFDDRDSRFLLSEFKRLDPNIKTGSEEDDLPMSADVEKTKCFRNNSWAVVGEDHAEFTCPDYHSHSCGFCGHVYSHEHAIRESANHTLECPCCTGKVDAWKRPSGSLMPVWMRSRW